MKLSYHAWKDFKDCPKKYYLKYIKKQPTTITRNDAFNLYGKLVEKFFQYFCNIWRFTMPYMPPEEIRFKMAKIYKDLLKVSEVDWSAPFVQETEESLFESACSDVCAIMDSQNQNYFLNSKSEVSIEVATKLGYEITGRLDFIHFDPLSKEPKIFDGKGTTKIGKNIDKNQVIFYALLYFFHYKIVPSELGFFYYRFNTYVPVEINLEILNEFRAQMSLDIKRLVAETDYKATPRPKACKYCDYRNICKECLEDQLSRKKPSKIELPDGEGIIEIGI